MLQHDGWGRVRMRAMTRERKHDTAGKPQHALSFYEQAREWYEKEQEPMGLAQTLAKRRARSIWQGAAFSGTWVAGNPLGLYSSVPFVRRISADPP